MATTDSPYVVRLTRLERRPDGRLAIAWTCSDKPTFLAVGTAIKARVPRGSWFYEPREHVWRIASAKDLLLALSGLVPDLAEALRSLDQQDSGPTTAAPASLPPTIERAYVALHLLPSAPRSLVKAAYRALAAETHPDVGGETAAMQRLNAARDTVMGWLDTRPRQGRAA